MPRIPCSTFAIVLMRPASGMVISTWAWAFAALNALNAATKKMVALMRSFFRPTSRPSRIAAEVGPRVRRSSRAIAGDFELRPRPS